MADRVVFSFAELNPATGTPYLQSRFGDLPGFVAVVVTARVGMCPGEWDELVKMGETAEFIDPHQQWRVSAAEVAAVRSAGWGDDDTIAVIGW